MNPEGLNEIGPEPARLPTGHVTKTGKVLTDADIEALADEAERGYDVSDQPPTEPTIWLAELVSEGRVAARVTVTTRELADQALNGRWRVVRYVRADQEAASELEHLRASCESWGESYDKLQAERDEMMARVKRLTVHAAAALERADVGDAEEAAAILRGVVTLDGHYIDGHDGEHAGTGQTDAEYDERDGHA